MNEILEIQDGPFFRLRDPHTIESVRADAARERPRLLCSLLWHNREVIGDVYYGEDHLDSPEFALLAAVAASDIRDLCRCKRCHKVYIRYAF